MITRMRPLGMFMLCTQLSACYAYSEVPRSAAAPGRAVRITVSAEEAVRQQPTLGALSQTVEGQVLQSEVPNALALSVRLREYSPADRPGFNAFLTVPWTSVTRVEEKRFSFARTAALAGLGAAAALVALAINASGTSGPEDPGTAEMRVRIPIR